MRMGKRSLLTAICLVALLFVLLHILAFTFGSYDNISTENHDDGYDVARIITATLDYHDDEVDENKKHVDNQTCGGIPMTVTEECLETIAFEMSRVWIQKHHRDWCSSHKNNNNSLLGQEEKASQRRNLETNDKQQPHFDDDEEKHSGLLLVKVPKSASSTVTGTVLRLQHLLPCPTRWQHGTAQEQGYANRSILHSFLMAPIRRPDHRAMSSLYFHKISLQRQPQKPGDSTDDSTRPSQIPRDEFVIHALDQLEPNYVSHYTALKPFPAIDDDKTGSSSNTISSHHVDENNNNKTTSLEHGLYHEIWRHVQDILDNYDFLWVVDDLEASLVVFAWLIDVPLSHVLTAQPSKRAGSWYLGGGRHCVRLVPPVYTNAIRKHLAWPSTSSSSLLPSDSSSSLPLSSWQLRHVGDWMLYKAARHSLQRTIDISMGRSLFESRLRELQALQRHVQDQCVSEIVFPCSNNGTVQVELSRKSCYLRDFGCGYPCMDRLLKLHSTANHT